jgi:hypothetical protein
MHERQNLFLSLILSIIFPFVFLWAVNTLFGLGIPLTFKTYLACLALLFCLRFFTSKTYYTLDPLFHEFYDGYLNDDDEEYEEEDENDDGPDDSSPAGRHLKRVK